MNTETQALDLLTQELDALCARSRDRGTDALQSLRSLGRADAEAQLLQAGNHTRGWNALQAHGKAFHAAMERLTQAPAGEDTDTSAEVAATNGSTARAHPRMAIAGIRTTSGFAGC